MMTFREKFYLRHITPILALERKDRECLYAAVKAAERSSFPSSRRVGSCLRYKGILVKGENQYRHRKGGVCHKSLHAEMHVIAKAINLTNESLRRFSPLQSKSCIYVARLLLTKKNLPQGQSNWLGNCRPCEKCSEFIYKAGIKRVKYTDIVTIEGKKINVLCELRAIKE